MDPDREGYISLEEDTTAPASSPSDGSSAELVETGLREEPCFVGHGPAWNNRQWLGWKPSEGFQLNSSKQAAHHLLPKWIASPKSLLAVLSAKSSAETLMDCHFHVTTRKEGTLISRMPSS